MLNFAATLAQASSASKNDNAGLVETIDFDDKLKILNKNVTLNKIKHLVVENELNELSQKVKEISTKWLTRDLIKKFRILNGAKYFSAGIFQEYLVFTPFKLYLKFFVTLHGLIRGNLMECQKEILKI